MLHDPFFDLVSVEPQTSFDLKRTAMITIDLQYLDAHPEGWMGRLAREKGKPNHLQERWENINAILPNVRRLQDACRKHGVEVIHVRVAVLTRSGRDGNREQRAHNIRDTYDSRDAEILEQVAPVGDEIVLSKSSVSTFNSTALDQILFNLDIRQLIITGIVTEGCVELTTRDAADRGYLVTLVSDGCASSNRVAHENALERMADPGIIAIRTTAEVLEQLEKAAVQATV